MFRRIQVLLVADASGTHVREAGHGAPGFKICGRGWLQGR
jgi:hypothetical protein